MEVSIVEIVVIVFLVLLCVLIGFAMGAGKKDNKSE